MVCCQPVLISARGGQHLSPRDPAAVALSRSVFVERAVSRTWERKALAGQELPAGDTPWTRMELALSLPMKNQLDWASWLNRACAEAGGRRLRPGAWVQVPGSPQVHVPGHAPVFFLCLAFPICEMGWWY